MDSDTTLSLAYLVENKENIRFHTTSFSLMIKNIKLMKKY